MSAGLTTEEVLEFAQRWAYNEAGMVVYGADAICEPEPLTDAERERLFAWVQEKLLQVSPIDPWVECEKRDAAGWISELLGIDDASAMALCEAAGWPS